MGLIDYDMSIRCEWCGEQFVQDHPKSESPRRFCGPTHRVKHQRHRKKMEEKISRPCPHPEKIGFEIRGLAILNASLNTRLFGLQQHVYYCTCGLFHMTTKPQW